MANKVLGKHALKEIRDSIERCTNPRQISAEAVRLAELNGVSKSRIYELTKDIRPSRKPRADRGRRIADLVEHPGLKYAASLVVAYHIDPAEAIRTAELRGHEIPVELATFQRYLRERGLSKKNRRTQRSNFRRFEAENPGDVFQFDISGSKERWFDTKTRKIVQVSVLDVSKNHENQDKTRTRIWRFVLTDDYSRRRFIRFVACDKPNGSHIVTFLLQAFEVLGVPRVLYTDNDAVIKFGRNKRAAEILDRALRDSGGYKLEQHKAGNSRATGKVENAHQWVEKLEKMLGLFLAEGRALTMEVLQRFAEQMNREWDNRIHRTTGEKPIDRWNSKLHTVRLVDSSILRSAFLVDEFEINILGDMTFKHKGVIYQLPTNQGLENLIAQQSSTSKCYVVFPDESEFYTLMDMNGNEYEIEKKVAKPDVFGEYKSHAEDASQKTTKTLKAFAKDTAKAEKTANKEGLQEPKPIPLIDTAADVPATKVLSFPKPTVDVTAEILEAAQPQYPSTEERVKVSEKPRYSGELISWYAAIRKHKQFFASVAECKEVLGRVFPDREENEDQPDSVVKACVEEFLINQPETPKLRIAK